METLLDLIRSFLSQSWRFFSEIKVPALDIPVGALFVGIWGISLGLRLFGAITGVDSGSPLESYGKSKTYRTKIDAKRKNDER